MSSGDFHSRQRSQEVVKRHRIYILAATDHSAQDSSSDTIFWTIIVSIQQDHVFFTPTASKNNLQKMAKISSI